MASNIVFDGTKGISLPSFTTTEKNAIVSPATGATVFDTTQNRQNVYAGGAWNAGLNSGTAVASTSGTTINFTGIPSWAKRITVMLDGVSTNGVGGIAFRLGTSGGVETTGYVAGSSRIAASSASAVGYTTSFALVNDSASYAISGNLIFTLLNPSTNTWTANGAFGSVTTIFNYFTAGSKSLSGTLDRVQILTSNGTDTFDAGSINILYE